MARAYNTDLFDSDTDSDVDFGEGYEWKFERDAGDVDDAGAVACENERPDDDTLLDIRRGLRYSNFVDSLAEADLLEDLPGSGEAELGDAGPWVQRSTIDAQLAPKARVQAVLDAYVAKVAADPDAPRSIVVMDCEVMALKGRHEGAEATAVTADDLPPLTVDRMAPLEIALHAVDYDARAGEWRLSNDDHIHMFVDLGRTDGGGLTTGNIHQLCYNSLTLAHGLTSNFRGKRVKGACADYIGMYHKIQAFCAAHGNIIAMKGDWTEPRAIGWLLYKALQQEAQLPRMPYGFLPLPSHVEFAFVDVLSAGFQELFCGVPAAARVGGLLRASLLPSPKPTDRAVMCEEDYEGHNPEAAVWPTDVDAIGTLAKMQRVYAGGTHTLRQMLFAHMEDTAERGQGCCWYHQGAESVILEDRKRHDRDDPVDEPLTIHCALQDTYALANGLAAVLTGVSAQRAVPRVGYIMERALAAVAATNEQTPVPADAADNAADANVPSATEPEPAALPPTTFGAGGAPPAAWLVALQEKDASVSFTPDGLPYACAPLPASVLEKYGDKAPWTEKVKAGKKSKTVVTAGFAKLFVEDLQAAECTGGVWRLLTRSDDIEAKVDRLRAALGAGQLGPALRITARGKHYKITIYTADFTDTADMDAVYAAAAAALAPGGEYIPEGEFVPQAAEQLQQAWGGKVTVRAPIAVKENVNTAA